MIYASALVSLNIVSDDGSPTYIDFEFQYAGWVGDVDKGSISAGAGTDGERLGVWFSINENSWIHVLGASSYVDLYDDSGQEIFLDTPQLLTAGDYRLEFYVGYSTDGPGMNYFDVAWQLVFALPADVNGDGSVGPADLAGVVASWGVCRGSYPPCWADINSDGIVGPDDLANLLSNWTG